MKVPYSYYEDEVRDGYYVWGMMKRVWAAQIEVLEEVDRVCRKHDIPYFAEWGTMLAAVRHKGFIPWDDDMDICMKREDYHRFLAVAKDELPDYFDVYNFHTDEENWQLLTRVINGKSMRLDDYFLDKFHGVPFVIGIDIFPMDYISRDEEAEKTRDDIVSFVAEVANGIHEENEKAGAIDELIQQIEDWCKVKLDRDKPLKQQLYVLLEELCAIFPPEESDTLTLLIPRLNWGGHLYPKEFYDEVVMLPFEYSSIPVVKNCDELLRLKYGNYLQLVREGGTHEYPFFESQEEKLKDYFGLETFRYKYRPEDLQRAEKPASVQEEVLKGLQILSDRQKQLGEILTKGSEDQVYSFLTECQNLAIGAGNCIEQKALDAEATVKLLENYCESLYQLSVMPLVDRKAQSQSLSEDLLGQLSQICTQVEKLRFRRQIVFLPYKASLWHTMEPVWKAAMADPQYDVYVMPLVYYDKNMDGSPRDTHYDFDLFPKELNPVGVNDYEFAKQKPDIIFTHNPYDECNQTTSVHPFFYSSNLQQFTRQLVYTPYFIIDEIAEGDGRGWKTLQFFVTMPGVVRADKIFVQSEQMKETYVKKLTEVAGPETREIWEKKIYGTGSPIRGVGKEILDILQTE